MKPLAKETSAVATSAGRAMSAEAIAGFDEERQHGEASYGYERMKANKAPRKLVVRS